MNKDLRDLNNHSKIPFGINNKTISSKELYIIHKNIKVPHYSSISRSYSVSDIKYYTRSSYFSN